MLALETVLGIRREHASGKAIKATARPELIAQDGEQGDPLA